FYLRRGGVLAEWLGAVLGQGGAPGVGAAGPVEAMPAGATVTTHMVAGAVAGILEHCVMYPIDCVKVRPGPAPNPTWGSPDPWVLSEPTWVPSWLLPSLHESTHTSCKQGPRSKEFQARN
uniref:Uncharacterized protein n=1 Tax=Canis lupus dingo TaxID=286419 RepID=A0A8C0LR35_CANLU